MLALFQSDGTILISYEFSNNTDIDGGTAFANSTRIFKERTLSM